MTLETNQHQLAGAEGHDAQASGEGAAGGGPAHEIRFRNIRATIWHNEGERGLWYSVRITRSYRDAEGNWHTADTFNSVELLAVAELARAAFYWIAAGQPSRTLAAAQDDEIAF